MTFCFIVLVYCSWLFFIRSYGKLSFSPHMIQSVQLLVFYIQENTSSTVQNTTNSHSRLTIQSTHATVTSTCCTVNFIFTRIAIILSNDHKMHERKKALHVDCLYELLMNIYESFYIDVLLTISCSFPQFVSLIM